MTSIDNLGDVSSHGPNTDDLPCLSSRISSTSASTTNPPQCRTSATSSTWHDGYWSSKSDRAVFLELREADTSRRSVVHVVA